MHVLIIPSSRFITETEPYSSIFQWHQAKALKKTGFKVGVLSVGYITLRYLFKKYKYKKIEKLSNINVYRKYDYLLFPHRNIPFFILKYLYIKKGLKYFEQYIKKEGMPDIIHAHNFFFGGFIAEAIKEKYGIDFIITEHSSTFDRGYIPSKLNNTILQCALSSLQVTAVSQNFAKNLKNRLSIDIKVLPNIVDEYFFSLETQNISISETDSFTFLNIATMNENKNQSLLIKAFANKFKNSNCLLRLGGSGPDKNKLVNLVKSLNIESQVKFLGKLSQKEVKKEMLNANCFLLSSNYETFGVVLIEALACRTPVISTKCGGPEDIVNEKNGILVEIGNIKEFANAMFLIYKNINSFDLNFISNDVKKKFGPDSFLENVLRFYRNS